jgi:2-C-methyl-D-erythritol 4-phosphate cytidylyltransferase
MLLEKEGFTIKMVEGEYSNIKLTTIEDLDIIRSINNTRVKTLNK